VLSLPWRAKLHACFALAKRHRAFVCTGAVAQSVALSISTREVEVLAVAQNDEGGVVVVHEMLGEKNLDEINLYDVGGAVPDGTSVLQLCVNGYYADAVAALRAMDDGTPLVANLLHRATVALQDPPQQFAARIYCDET
jgi:hypothetical protein